MYLFRLIYILISLFIYCDGNKDKFDEELVITPLPNGNIYVFFNFVTQWNFSTNSANHYRYFPRPAGEIFQRFQVDKIHISLTEGFWRHEYWGYPIVSSPPGAEVLAIFNKNVKDVDHNWKFLTEALSGLLCASLNFIDPSNTIKPELTFLNEFNYNSSHIRYATLPREIVCTENLTPWRKLLPCDLKKGFSSLFNSEYIHNTKYHSLSLDFVETCRSPSCTFKTWQIKQSISLVYDPALLPLKNNWSFRYLFNQGLHGTCVLAETSKIYVDKSHNTTNLYDLSPKNYEIINVYRGNFMRNYAVYDLKKIHTKQPFSLGHKPIGQHKILTNTPPPLHITRHIIGYGQEKGGIAIKLYNNHWDKLDVIILENLPWFIPVYLHTLKINSKGKLLKPNFVKYTPGETRRRASYLEIGLTLLPSSITTVSIDFDYVFLKWQEYPPDANHGFYVGSAIITCRLPLARNYTSIPNKGGLFADSFNFTKLYYPIKIYSEVIVVTLPTPDFSMPYNVICLACTIIALAFGPIHNITTKSLHLKDNKKIATIADKIFSFFKKS